MATATTAAAAPDATDADSIRPAGVIGRAWVAVLAAFRPALRRMTADEALLSLRVAAAERQLEDERQALRVSEAQRQVQAVEIKGLVGIIAMHEKRWEAEAAIEGRRIALAGRLEGQR